MKKIGKCCIAFLLFSALFLGLAACGDTIETQNETDEETPKETRETKPTEASPTEASLTEVPETVYAYRLESGEDRTVSDMTFDARVTVEGDHAVIRFLNCHFTDSVICLAAEGTQVHLDEKCVLDEGVTAILRSGVKEATADYVLPRFVTSIPLTAEAEDLGAVYGKPGVPITFNGKTYTQDDMEYLSVNGILLPKDLLLSMDTEYPVTDGYLVSHWWENGTEIEFLKAECTIGGKDAPPLFLLDPAAEQLISDTEFSGPVFVDGSSGSLRFEHCGFQSTLTVLASGETKEDGTGSTSQLSLSGCDLAEGLEVRGIGADVSLQECTVHADVVNAAPRLTKLYLREGCSFDEGVKAVIRSGVREADVNYALPKICLSAPLEAVCEDLGGIHAFGEFEVLLNGTSFSPADIRYYTLNGEETNYDGTLPLVNGYLVAQWWENGEEIRFVGAQNEHHYTLRDLDPADERLVAYRDFPNLGIFVDPKNVNATYGYLNVRNTPELGSDNIVGTLLPFHAVNIIGEEGDFYQVDSGSLKGVYVAKKYIMTGEDAEWLVLSHVTHKVKVRVNEGVRMRRTTSTANLDNVITILFKGTEYTFSEIVTGEDGKEWVCVYFGEEESGEGGQHSPVYGYVRRDVVDIEYALPTAISLIPVSYYVPVYPAVQEPSPQIDPGAETFKLPTEPRRRALVEYAMHWLGTPYVWAGTQLGVGVDCSGFVLSVYKDVLGINLPHYSASQSNYGRQVSAEEMQPGDLIFYAPGGGNISHVVMYIGNGMFIHASTDTMCVTITNYFNYLKPVKIMTLEDSFPAAPRQKALDLIDSWG